MDVFDLERYTRNSRALRVDDLPWDTVAQSPLREAEVRFLTYMMNIETHTIVYLKELLQTRVIEDPEVTAFLSCWAYEEYFHGAALERFLKAYVGASNVRNDTSYRLAQSSRFGRFAKRLVTPLAAVVSPDFAAVHMTWGAAQEITTLNGYEQVARKTAHPMLKELMERIIRDERRHFAFYYNQAHRRLEGSKWMRKETRWAMDRLWKPVGVGAMPPAESDFAAWYLFKDAMGQTAIRGVDETMGKLPGMDGWNGLTRETLASIRRVDAVPAEYANALQVRNPAPAAA